MMCFKRIRYSVYLFIMLLPFYGVVSAESKTDEELILKLILDIDNGNDSVCKDRHIEDKSVIPTDLEKVGYDIGFNRFLNYVKNTKRGKKIPPE